MTLVYAKIMGIFVCGAEPGVGGRGWGSKGWGIPGNVYKWVNTQMAVCRGWGGVCMYVTEM